MDVSIFKEEFEDKLLQIAAATDEFEGYRRPHALRIAVIANALAQKFNLASHDCFSLQQAAMVHDIGEALMNREYFKAKRLLRTEERVDMQRHPVIGEQEAAKQGLSRAVQLLVRWHHEWWNGTGYPDALEQEHIPLAARILRVADTYAALTDDRPYKAAVSKDEARKYLIEWAGIEFDPKVVKAFLALEGLKELESFAASEQTQTPAPETVEPLELVAVETRDDFRDNAEKSAFQTFWDDNN
jgi:HD-GYP domain-containing protein (c-di-GMP phosphodiesterase class II)